MIRGVLKNLVSFGSGAIMLGYASQADAALIIQNESFTTAGGTAVVGFQEFDPTLGTLNSVGVEFSGIVRWQVTTPGFSTTLSGAVFDAEGAGGRGFDIGGFGGVFGPASVSTGDPDPLTVTWSFLLDLDFTFNNLTDLVGFAIPNSSLTPPTFTPPSTVEGLRSDFIEGIVPVGITETLTFLPTFSAFNVSAEGSVILTYNYTPPVSSVPAPPALGIFLAGLVGLGVCRRQRGPRA